ncbi:hypothetical protein PQG45_07915 [Aquirufa sp. LEOWEIH-7C]|uniref:Uncharacterized protein n=2 Tax=Aquirufa regiilacus TaxID=3024868 RepID=A0ABU3TSV9_9BACT|nr:hypothetical protein [Aquirufa sp. LEOWEIH-7C]
MSYLNDFLNTLMNDDIQIIHLKNKLLKIENPRIIKCNTWDECWESVDNLGLKNRRIFSMTHQNFELYDAHEMYLSDTNVKTMKLHTGIDPSKKEQFSEILESINHMVFLLDTRDLMKERDEPGQINNNEYSSTIYKSQTKSNLESDFKVKGITIIIY